MGFKLEMTYGGLSECNPLRSVDAEAEIRRNEVLFQESQNCFVSYLDLTLTPEGVCIYYYLRDEKTEVLRV